MARIDGVNELLRNLRNAEESPTRMLDTICRNALEPLQAQTESNARRHRQPRRPRNGHLDEGVVIARVRSSRLVREFWVTFSRRARKIAHLVEFGTKPHWQPRRRGGIMHPGARPFPFFRPAYDARREEVINVFGRGFWAAVVASIRPVRIR